MIRFGIVGTNNITEKFIAAASAHPDFELSAVYSRTDARAKEFAAKFEVQHTFTDLTKMAESDVLDAVYIASPNSLHAEQSILFLSHGKHVLCEKPLASNQEEVAAMIKAAQDHQVLLMEAMKSMFVPNFKSLQAHLHKIGTVRRYFANFCRYSSRYDEYKQGLVLNSFNPAFSNGALMDIGVYCIYPMAALFGMPKRVQASGSLLESGVDGDGTIMLSHEGVEGIIAYSKTTSSQLPSEIQGENGSMLIDHLSAPSMVVIHYNDGTAEDISQPQLKNVMYYEAKEIIDSYDQHKLMLYRVCFTYMKNTADTEDMVQDTFIQLIKKGPAFESSDHEKAWLIRVATNLCKNKLKHWWRKRGHLEHEESLPGSANVEVDETFQVIMDLPDKYKTVIYLYYYEGYDSVEISRILEKPPSTVRNHLHEARNLLRKTLGGEFE